jgi:hypothetical protein
MYNLYKKSILLVICLLGLCITGVIAQNAFTASGGTATGAGGTVSYSIGQVFYKTYSGGGFTVLEGVEQANVCVPVIINVSSKSANTAIIHPLTGVPAGSLLVLTTTNNTNVPPYNCIVTSTPALTWTKRVDAGAISSNNAEIWTAVYTAGGAISVRSDWGVAAQASVVYTVLGAEPVLGGASGTAVSQSAPSVSVTTTRTSSVLFGCTSDWNGINGAVRVLRDGATDRFYYRDVAKGYTTYFYTKGTTGIGTYTEGVQSPTGQRASTAVLEVRCPGTPDNTPPTVISVTPLNGATNVATNTAVTATFSEAMNPATINGTTFELRNPSSALVAATVTYNAGTNTAILTPSSALANGTTYTAKVIGGAAGVKDLAGNAMVGDYTWTFTTAAAPACNLTIVSTDTKSNTSATVHSLSGVPAGALLVLNTTNNTNAAPYNAIVTSSPALTWTKRVDAGATSSNNAEIWTAVSAAGGSISVTSNWGTAAQASVVYVVTGAESVLGGASGTATSQSAPSVSVTTTRANSILFGCTSDWNGIDGAARVLRDAATDRFYFRNAAKGYTTYFYTKATTATGVYTEGVQSPTGQKAATAVLEIRCPGAPPKLTNPVVDKTPVYNYNLEQNYPNPASGETSIRFTIPKAEKVSLTVYDINGRVLKVLVHGSRDAGTHTVSFNTGSLAGGVYYYRMKAGDFIKAKKLTVGR